MRKLLLGEVIDRIKEIHGDIITIDEKTYVNAGTKCRFVDVEFGEYWTSPVNVFNGKVCRKRAAQDRERTNLILFGVKNPAQSSMIKSKMEKTCMDRFGVKSPLQSPVVRDKIKHTNMERYGVENAGSSPDIREKAMNTLSERFGMKEVITCPFQILEIDNKRKETFMSKYGVEWLFCSGDIQEKAKDTNISKYGVPNPSQNREIALKNARANRAAVILNHWKTNEELICVASYERKVVKYLNDNQIEYEWQPQVFKMPPDENGKVKTYRPDLYLIEGQLWVEIKGYFRGKSKDKWDWFHSTHRNSELWNESRLKELGIL